MLTKEKDENKNGIVNAIHPRKFLVSIWSKEWRIPICFQVQIIPSFCPALSERCYPLHLMFSLEVFAGQF